MLKLCNFSNYPDELEMFKNGSVNNLLRNHNLDGVELLFGQEWSAEQLPKERIKGVHLPFYVSWMDFWFQDKDALIQNFGTLQQAYDYYGGEHPEVLVEKYCEEIQRAVNVGAQYVVFHVSQIRPQEVFSYEFAVTDQQVIKASAELLNLVFKRINTNICLLLENLWWPGLTLCNKEMALLLLSSVEYPNKGFMLDTGHLMNTNTELNNQQAGIEYILSTIHNLGDVARYIRGIHLHYSLSGEYVRSITQGMPQARTGEAMQHVLNIDQHLPFSHKDVQQILAYVQPDYLVHEFMYSSRQQLSEYLDIQSEALESGDKA